MLEAALKSMEGLPDGAKFLWVLASLSAHLLLGAWRPFAGWRPGSFRVNAALLASTLAINAGFGAATLAVSHAVASRGWGLLQVVELPLWVEWLGALVVLDLVGQYTAHFLLHRIPLLWRLHAVHHSDPHVDATTGTRHHPLDFVFRETMALVALALTGAPFGMYISYRLLTVFFTYFTHADVDLPPALDRVIGWVFVSPRMHKFHHHDEAPWTDRNYGNILSVWDRLFGTLVDGDVRKVRYGLDVADARRGDDLGYQLLLPFRLRRRS
jgi:sterol desaturase/sphingolipid hydroxylase (fatty acid hydroxylase superfamily)